MMTFRIVLDLQNYCEDGTEKPHMSHSQFLLLLTSLVRFICHKFATLLLTKVHTLLRFP